MRTQIERSVLIEAEPAAVFAALTSPALVQRWLCHDATIEPREGGLYAMAWRGSDAGRELRYQGLGRIQSLAHAKLLVLQMQDGPGGSPGSRVGFELTPQAACTRLTLRHGDLDRAGEVEDLALAYARGWPSCLELLRSLLEDPPDERLVMASLYRDLPVPGEEPCGLAWDGEQLWLGEASTARIYRIDVEKGEPLASIAYDGEPADLTWDGTHLWQADTEKRALVRLDPRSGRIAATLRVPGQDGELAGLTWDGSGLWVSLTGEPGGLLRLDARSGSLVATRPASATASGLAFDGQAIWLGDYQQRSLSRVDPSSGAITRRVAVKGWPAGVGWDGERIWFVDREWSLLSRILDLPVQDQ